MHDQTNIENALTDILYMQLKVLLVPYKATIMKISWFEQFTGAPNGSFRWNICSEDL